MVRKLYLIHLYRKYLTNSIGNLLALSRSKNSKFSNDSFEEKKNGRTNSNGIELYRGYRHGSHSEIEVSKYENWTEVEIIDRGNNLLKFMSDRWQLNLSEQQIEELLFIKVRRD
ncbi:HNH endonuclease [Listeria monocytogenes]|nr:HNH endonuclease [Listeria monocytogenes]EGN2098105.1 HNH endonuclease [Listeria monocytogenes]